MPSSHKPYPAYKPSGIDWLGEVPEHWEVKRLKFLVSQPLQYGANDEGVLGEPGLPRYVRITDIKKDGTLREDTFKSLPEGTFRPYLLRQADILLARSGATVGKTFLYQTSWGRVAYAGYLIRARIDERKAVPLYVYYFTRSRAYWNWVGSSFIQATIQNISAEKYANLLIPLPDVQQQQAIAAFLDRETARIDAFIAKKQRLIELLKEKRPALITQAVTKGLDPSVPMKDSGFEWLGGIPEGWEVVPFKHAISFQEGPGIMASDFTEQGVPLLRIRNLNGEYVDLNGCNFLDPEKVNTRWFHFKLMAGDILISCSASTGIVSEVDKKSEGSIAYTGIIRLTPRNRFTIKTYIKYLVVSSFYLEQIDLMKSGSTIQHYGPTHLRQVVLVLPPLPEQHAIATFLDRETARIDALVAKVEEAIAKLQEYRTALITAAVTGKIDVRGVGTR